MGRQEKETRNIYQSTVSRRPIDLCEVRRRREAAQSRKQILVKIPEVGPSFTERIFPTISESEEQEPFSWPRFRRGAKKGAIVGAGIILGTAVGIATKGSIDQGNAGEALSYFKDSAGYYATSLSFTMPVFGLVGGLMDGVHESFYSPNPPKQKKEKHPYKQSK